MAPATPSPCLLGKTSLSSLSSHRGGGQGGGGVISSSSSSSWLTSEEVLKLATDPKQLSALVEKFRTPEQKRLSEEMKEKEKEEPLLQHNEKRWVNQKLTHNTSSVHPPLYL